MVYNLPQKTKTSLRIVGQTYESEQLVLLKMKGVENDQTGIKHISHNYKHTFKSHSYVTISFTRFRHEEKQIKIKGYTEQ